MNIYYTAKDIEDLAAQGVQQLEIGNGVTLTDFARETASQLSIALVDSSRQASPAAAPTPAPSSGSAAGSKYNKPTGCQHAASTFPAAPSQASVPTNRSAAGADSNTMNRLIDLVGKVVKRGG